MSQYQDVATTTFDNREVVPVGAPAKSFALPIQLLASTVYPRGSALALVTGSTTGTYQLYTQGASDGSQLAECVLKRACATDASGFITYGAAATGGQWGQTEYSTSAWFGGVFDIADVVTAGSHGLDSAGVTALGGKLIQAGKFLTF